MSFPYPFGDNNKYNLDNACYSWLIAVHLYFAFLNAIETQTQVCTFKCEFLLVFQISVGEPEDLIN